MPSFDFLTNQKIRESLERDYRELESSIEQQNWKCAQVLSGSIVEGLLVDYLSTHANPTRTDKTPPLKMTLAVAVAACLAEGIITQRAADLCSVVRSYRNLIHPGLVVRVGEDQPTKNSASIAHNLVDLITEEFARELRRRVGYTAEQIVSKVERDSQALKVFSHLVEKLDEHQRERLLLDLLPSRHEAALNLEDAELAENVADRLEQTYRILFKGAEEPTRLKAMAAFATILREADGDHVKRYSDAFVIAADLAHASPSDAPIIKRHLLSKTAFIHRSLTGLVQLNGIRRYLVEDDVASWLDPLVRAYVHPETKKPLLLAVKRQLDESIDFETQPTWDKAVIARFNWWVTSFEKREQVESAALIRAILNEVEFFY